MKSFELKASNQKSYYGKATVFERSDGWKILKSYDTEVCGIDSNGIFHRYWNNYSATAMKHVNDFLRLYNIPGGGKAWWTQQKIENFNWIAFYIGYKKEA